MKRSSFDTVGEPPHVIGKTRLPSKLLASTCAGGGVLLVLLCPYQLLVAWKRMFAP